MSAEIYRCWWNALFILATGRPLNAEAILSVMPGTIAGVPNIRM